MGGGEPTFHINIAVSDVVTSVLKAGFWIFVADRGVRGRCRSQTAIGLSAVRSAYEAVKCSAAAARRGRLVESRPWGLVRSVRRCATSPLRADAHPRLNRDLT